MLNFDYSALESNSQLKTFARRACSTVQGVQHTYILAREALKVEGVFVECGVGYGANAAAMLQASIDAGDQRPLHLFDSFQGIPLAGPEDDQQFFFY